MQLKDGIGVQLQMTSTYFIVHTKTINKRIDANVHRVQCKIPTVIEAATEIERKRRELDSNVGLYIETKRPAWHRSIGLPLEEKLVEDILASGFSGIILPSLLFSLYLNSTDNNSMIGPIIIQSFEEESLRIFKELKPAWPRVRLVIDLKTAADYGVDSREAIPYRFILVFSTRAFSSS
jgi:glycerophosphoryl diester phosphodiesterase